MLESIDKYLEGIVTPLRPAGGMQIPCLLQPGWSEAKTIEQAANVGVKLAGLSRLYAGQEKQFGWLLGYSSLSDHEIETAMQQLAHAIRNS